MLASSLLLAALISRVVEDPKVSLELRCEPLPVALKQLFPLESDRVFEFKGKTRSRKVSLFVENRPRSEVLKQVLNVLDLDLTLNDSGKYEVREEPGFLTREAKVLAYYRVQYQSELDQIMQLGARRFQIGTSQAQDEFQALLAETERLKQQKPAGWRERFEQTQERLDLFSSPMMQPGFDWFYHQLSVMGAGPQLATWTSDRTMRFYSTDGTQKIWISPEPASGGSNLSQCAISEDGSLVQKEATSSRVPGSFPEELPDEWPWITELKLKPDTIKFDPKVLVPGDADAGELLFRSQKRPVVMEGLRSVSGPFDAITSKDASIRDQLRLRYFESGDWIFLKPEDVELKRAMEIPENLIRPIEQGSRPSFDEFTNLVASIPATAFYRLQTQKVRGDLLIKPFPLSMAGTDLWRSLPGITREQLQARKVLSVLSLNSQVLPRVLECIRFPGATPNDPYMSRRVGEWKGFNALDSLYLEQTERGLSRALANGVTVSGDVNDGVENAFPEDPRAKRDQIYESKWSFYLGTSAKESLQWSWGFIRSTPFGVEKIPISNQPIHRHGHGPGEQENGGFKSEPD